MSNYNSILQSNNTDLQAILNTINELPEAGGSGGGSVETFTVNLTCTLPGGFKMDNVACYYTDKNLETKSVEPTGSTYDIEVVKNSIITISSSTSSISNPIGCEKLGGGMGVYSYRITNNNASLTIGL